MPRLKLRDRDAVLTQEGLILRVYGYSHPSDTYVCDVEYAPASIFKSDDPRALRIKGKQNYYKFYSDQGLQFVRDKYPQYAVWYDPLKASLVGVSKDQILKTRIPSQALRWLLNRPRVDALLEALQRLADIVSHRSSMSLKDFGVFGSLLHGFYHPLFSDLDLIVYGQKELRRLRETLATLYSEKASSLRNEFETEGATKDKHWKFVNYSPKEYCWHQRRKMIYSMFEDGRSGRIIKAEFEPVKAWNEIRNEYDPNTRIMRKGWINATARVIDDSEASFMPSNYKIDLSTIFRGLKVRDVQRIVSYVEEFRLQAERDEEVYVEGNLERVITQAETFDQITLTYGPRYYEQVLKVSRLP